MRNHPGPSQQSYLTAPLRKIYEGTYARQAVLSGTNWLIDRDIFASRFDHPPLEVAEIATFLDFGDIDDAPTALSG